MSSESEPAGAAAPRAQVVARNSIWMTLDALVALPVSLALSILVARSIGPDVLEYTDAEQPPEEVVYTIVSGTQHGEQETTLF